MAVELETERLRLRRWREDDVEAYLAFYRDPVTQAVFGTDVSIADVWRRIAVFLGHWQLRGYGMWAIEDKASRRFAGYCGLWYPPEFGDVDLGWGLAREFRGRGFATEAALGARDHGYRIGLARLVSYILPENLPSIRVAERLGARADGSFVLQGKPHTVYVHAKP